MSNNWINKEHLKSMSDGDTDFEQELLNLFVEDSSPRIKLISTALGTADQKVLTTELHTLKGASANVGATKVEELAGQMEKAARDANIDLLKELFPSLEDYFKKTIDEIHAGSK